MRIDVRPLPIPDILVITPGRAGDARGYFSELFNQAELAAHGVHFAPVQENLAFSADAGVLRGLHAQAPPSAQAKLIRVARGRIFDVSVDARRGSPTFGRWTGVELSAEQSEFAFIPAGFLHGYVTLEPGCEVIYLVDAPYDPESELRVRWDDPQVGIAWPLSGEPIVSAPDRAAPLWAEFRSPFSFG